MICWLDQSFVHAQQVLIHLYRVDVPYHLGLCHRCHSPQVLEEASWHIFVELTESGLYLSLQSFNDLDDILGVFCHIFSELELRLHVFLLVELDVAGLEEVALDGDTTLNGAFGDLPLGHPFTRVEVAQLHVLACDAYIDVQGLLCQVHEY